MGRDIISPLLRRTTDVDHATGISPIVSRLLNVRSGDRYDYSHNGAEPLLKALYQRARASGSPIFW
jgi:hypothetical protein